MADDREMVEQVNQIQKHAYTRILRMLKIWTTRLEHPLLANSTPASSTQPRLAFHRIQEIGRN